MARPIDGTIFFLEPNLITHSVDITGTKELITCKNCKFSIIEDVYCDDEHGVSRIVAKNMTLCRFGNKYETTNPDGYCHLAKRKDVLNG